MSRAHWIALAAALACFVAASLPGQEDTAQPPAYGSSVDGHFGGSQPISGFERPLMLSGKVVLDNGAPPPEPVAIYMSCGGRKVPKGYASIKGTFSIDLTGRRDSQNRGCPGFPVSAHSVLTVFAVSGTAEPTNDIPRVEEG